MTIPWWISCGRRILVRRWDITLNSIFIYFHVTTLTPQPPTTNRRTLPGGLFVIGRIGISCLDQISFAFPWRWRVLLKMTVWLCRGGTSNCYQRQTLLGGLLFISTGVVMNRASDTPKIAWWGSREEFLQSVVCPPYWSLLPQSSLALLKKSILLNVSFGYFGIWSMLQWKIQMLLAVAW